MNEQQTPDAVRAIVDRAVGNVLSNASNYPEPAQVRILGQDTSPLRKKVTNAVLHALASRTVETAEEWEYGVLWARERASGYESDWSGWSWPGDLAGAESFARAHLDGLVLRRRPPGPTEPVPPTPKEASR
jgi:hypothetical protein